MKFPPTLIQEVKERLSIVSYIGESVVLKKSGANHKGLCPFHGEKSPSFMVHEAKQIFHCFGCGVGGDVIQFVMQKDGVSFPEAVRHLADRAGVELPVEGDEQAVQAAQEAKKKRKLLLRVNELAAEFFASNFRDEATGSKSRKYMESRGYSDDAFLTQHFIGSADDSWEGLVNYLNQRKVPMELACELGLVRRRKGSSGHYDFFRNRVMFPIRGVRGDVVAFGGRALPGDDESVKYLNSSDSAVFHKSKTLYGFPLAGEAMRSADRAIVVEGYLDVLALQQVGIGEAVAPLGTALTEEHLRLLMRYSHNLYIIFDGDAAGKRAAERSLPMCLPLGLVPRVVVLPVGEDPDTIVRSEGAEGIESRLQAAPTLFEWYIDETIAAHGTDTAAQVQVIQELKPMFEGLRDVVQAARYVERIAQALRMEREVVATALRGGKVVTKTAPAPKKQSSGQQRAERACLEFILHVPGAMAAIAHAVQPELFTDPELRAAADTCWAHYEREGDFSVERLFDTELPETVRRTLSLLAFHGEKYQDVEDSAHIAHDLITALTRPQWRTQLAELNSAIAEAERQGAAEQVLELMGKKHELLRAQRSSGS